MTRKPEISRQTVEAAAQSPAVREALAAKARRMLPRAQRLAAQSGATEFGQALHTSEGTRPGSQADGFERPYARIEAEITDEMDQADAGAKLTRRQILRRSAGA